MFANPPRHSHTLCTSGVLALCFIVLEALKACRSSQWSGANTAALEGLAAGFLVYWLVLAALTGLVSRLLRRVLPAQPQTLAALGALLAGALLWAGLSCFREYAPTLDDAIVSASLGAWTVFLLYESRRGRLGFWGACAFTLVLLIGILSALGASGYYFLFHPQRAEAVTIFPALWAALCAVGGYTCWARGLALRALFLLGALLLPPALAAGLTWRPLPPSGSRANLVFIVADTLRAQSMSLNGGPVNTPRLAGLAADGVLFARAYALAPWTMPSMAGMMASVYPPGLTPGTPELWLGQLWRYDTPPGVPTLATRLEADGYATAALTANALLPAMPNLMQGFQTRAAAHPILLTQTGMLSHLPFSSGALGTLCPPLARPRASDTSASLTRYARAWLRRHRDTPFYLWVHYMDPHAPYDPPAEPRTVRGRWPLFYPYDGGERWEGMPILGKNFAVAPEDRPFVRSLYEGEVQYVDQLSGRVLDTLDALGVRDQTYICFTSDHGEELWEHGEWGHARTMYDELVHVPLVLAGPGIKPRRIGAPVSAIDVTPTLATLLGAADSPAWRGRSWSAALQNPAAPLDATPVFAQATSNKAPEPLQMHVAGNYKLVRNSATGAVALYNLADDPGETTDISAAHPELVETMRGQMDAWRGTFDATFAAEPAEIPGLGREIIEQFESLGYLH